MLGVAHAGVAGAVNNPDASQIIICRQIAQFHWEPPAWFVAKIQKCKNTEKQKYTNTILQGFSQFHRDLVAWFVAKIQKYKST